MDTCIIMALITFIYVFPHFFFYISPSFGSSLFKRLLINLQDIFLSKIFFIHCVDLFVYLLCRYSFVHSNYFLCILSMFSLITMITLTWARMVSLCAIPTKHINYPVNDLIQVTDSYLVVYKIIISMGQNMDDVCAVNESKYSAIRLFLHFVISVTALIGMIYCVFYFARASYALNIITQLRVRIFMLIIMVLMNVFLICFHRPYVNVVLYYTCLVGVVLFAVYLSWLFDPISIGMNNITSEDPHLQILFITNILESGKSKLYFEIYNERMKKHYLFCGRCLLCKGIDEEEKATEVPTFETFQKIFLGILIKKQRLERIENKSYNFIFDFLILLSEINSHLELNYSLHVKFKRLLFKYRNFNGYKYFNLKYIYEQLCDKIKQQENTEQRHFITYYNINQKLQLALDKLIEFILQPYSVVTPRDVLELSENFIQIANKQHKCLNERDKMQYYPLVLMRIVHEELLNLPISKFEGSLRESENYNEDFLNQHFNEDRTMILSLNSTQKAFLVERVGHNLHWYLKRDLSDMFPADFKQYAIQRLNDVIRDSSYKTKLFTFIINKSQTNDSPSYETFSYSFYISPALKEEDFLIFGEYIIGSRGLLITVQFNPHEELVYWISEELSKDLSLINYLNKKNIYKNKEPKTPNRYAKFNILNFMNKVSHRKLSFSGQKNHTFKLFIEFTTNASHYKIFFVKPKRRFKESVFPFFLNKSIFHYTSAHFPNPFQTHLTSSSDENDDNDDDSDDNKSIDVQAENPSDTLKKMKDQYKHYKKRASAWVDDNSSVRTTSTASSVQQKLTTSSQLIFGGHKRTQPIIIYSKRFVYTKSSMVLCSIVMIVFNVLSLFIEISQNQKIREMNSIYTNLRSANSLYYNLISSLFSVICIGDQHGKPCVSYYQEHSLNEIRTNNIKVNLYEFLLHENKYTISEFRDRVKVLKRNIYSLKDATITDAFEQEFQYKKLSITNSNVNVITQSTTFANGLDLLINSVYSIINERNISDHPIYFFSSYPQYDFSYLKNVNAMTAVQIEYYNCFLNYVSYLLTWKNIQVIMSEIIQTHLKVFYRVSMIFMICSFLFHLILGCLLFFYLYSFLWMFMINIEKIIASMRNERNVQYFKKKFTVLKSFCNLYEANPLTLIKHLDDMDWQVQNAKNQKISQTQSKVFTVHPPFAAENKHIMSFNNNRNNKHNFYYSWMSYYDLLSYFFHYVICIIVYYIVLFLVFSLLWEHQMGNTKLIFVSIESISIAESNGFNGLSLSLMMIMTNQTTYISSTHSKTQGGNETLESSLLNSVKVFYDFEKGNKKLIKTINDYFELTCDNFYTKLNDSKIYQVSKLYSENELIAGLINDCKVHRYFEFQDEKIFSQSVCHNLIQFLHSLYQDVSYEGFLKQMKSKILMKLLNQVFIVFRPMRNWLNEVVYNEGIHHSLNQLTLIFVVYLVINNLSEIVLLLLIYFFFIVEVKKINKKINLLLSVVSMKEEHKHYSRK